MRNLAPLIMLVGTVSLLQYHSILFWTEFVGATGWAYSILLEVGGLWFWYRQGIKSRMTGLAISVMLLAGPFYNVSHPLFATNLHELQRHESQSVEINETKQAIKSLELSLSKYLENSSERTGWLPAINRTQEALAKNRERLSVLLSEKSRSTLELNWQRQIVIIMQALSLVVFQIMSISAITTLSARTNYRHHSDKNNPEYLLDEVIPERLIGLNSANDDTVMTSNCHSDVSVMTSGDDSVDSVMTSNCHSDVAVMTSGDDSVDNVMTSNCHSDVAVMTSGDDSDIEFVEHLAQELEAHLKDENTTQREFSKMHDIQQSQLSMINNHRARVEAGKRTASTTVISKVSQLLGIPVPEDSKTVFIAKDA